jgi:DNA-binding transcriptional LysR family regulator
MHVTLDQARALDAFARAGTWQAAGKRLHRAHTAVLYAVRQLEAQSGLQLLDRSGYRTRLTTAGEQVLRDCRRLLDAEAQLAATCAELQSGWEPSLKVVFDAIVPLSPALEMVRALREAASPTRVQLSVDSLDGVERRFEDEAAQMLVSVLPLRDASLTVVALPRLKARLVAHRKHPLAKAPALDARTLERHVLLTVRGGDPRLQLPTAQLERQSMVHLSDFHAKKAAVMKGLGFGWLPDWLCADELQKGELVALKLARGAVHAFEPRVGYRAPLGRAGRALLEALTHPEAR